MISRLPAWSSQDVLAVIGDQQVTILKLRTVIEQLEAEIARLAAQRQEELQAKKMPGVASS